MPLPKRRHSNARTGKRRAHNALRRPQLTECKQCHQRIRPHTVCDNCGYYNGQPRVQVEGA